MATVATVTKTASKTLYPIAEVFTELQGEGLHAGQLQTFIRLAGCTVGRRYPVKMYEPKKETIFHEHDSSGDRTVPFPSLHIYRARCTLFDGRTFACDTDYRLKGQVGSEEIVGLIPRGVSHVCLTGGEPLMHDLSTLITYLWDAGKNVHIETSGTIFQNLPKLIWVTVSPKQGVLESMIERADEVKILVDGQFDPEQSIALLPGGRECRIPELAQSKTVYLQPVNEENTVRADNLQLCRKWQRLYPQFRISVQLHKVLGQVLKEHSNKSSVKLAA